MSSRDAAPLTPNWPFVVAGLVLIATALIANEWVLGAWLTVEGRITNPASRFLLAAIDVAALVAGLVLVIRGRQAPWRQMLMSVVATVMALAMAEAGIRLVFGVRAWRTPVDRELDATLGWRPVANLTLERDMPGFGRVRYSTTRDGFRVFGDPATTKFKILAIGDSFTEAATVSDGETYYEHLGRARSGIEVFAIGGGGYGTLQEYLLLDRWVDVIRPDLVLVQTHPNDLINNSHALESRSTTDNNQMTRPYWEDGAVAFRFPENAAWGLLYNLVRHSYLLRLINVNVVFLRAREVGSVEKTATRDDPDVRRATETTVTLLAMMRRRAGVPVAVFSVLPDAAPGQGLWSVEDVSRRAGVSYIAGVGEAVAAAEAAGDRVSGQPRDAHWNGRGHEVAAGVIANWLDRGEWKAPDRGPSR